MSGVRYAPNTGTKVPAPEQALRAERPYRTALVLKNRVNPAYISAMKAGQAAAARYGIQVTNFVPEKPDDLEEQSALLASVIDAATYDAAVFTPVDSVAQMPLVQRANASGLPVHNISNLLAGGEIVSFTGSDDVAIGRLVIEWLAGRTGGSARMAVITGSPMAPTAVDRARGVDEALAQHAGLVCLAAASAYYDRLRARDVAAAFLREHAGLQWIVALNDEMALGALAAIDDAGAKGRVKVTGVNGIPEGLLAVQAGRLAATVDYALYSIAYRAIETAVRHLNGERLQEQHVLLPTKLIDEGNVGEVIDERRSWGMM